MQRDRARERHERARRQWELEHAEMPPGSGPPPSSNGGAGVQTGTTSYTASMNHIGETVDGMPGFSLVRFFRIPDDTLFSLIFVLF